MKRTLKVKKMGKWHINSIIHKTTRVIYAEGSVYAKLRSAEVIGKETNEKRAAKINMGANKSMRKGQMCPVTKVIKAVRLSMDLR